MSFFTTLCFYRPCTPPAITADAISRFVAELDDTDLIRDSSGSVKVKFGGAIDADDKPAHWEEQERSGLYSFREIDWDIDQTGVSTRQAIIDSLAPYKRAVYRANIELGSLADEVSKPITRENSPENEVDFLPYGISLEIGPVRSFSMASEHILQVGWISLNLLADGYLFPWTFRDVVQRLDDSAEIQRLTAVCKSFWPVPPELPHSTIAQLRQEIGELWPYDEFDKPWDWYWGIQEG